MVAPIALFPDKLVAQVLAGSTYPDQITAADNLLAQNPNVTGTALANLVNPEPWDASVKGLTQFPSVLDQMAQNIQWTTSLGEAYVNDPTDVMNAIQVMRQRAQKHGTLHSSAQMQVVTQSAASSTPIDEDAVVQSSAAAEPPVYSGPAVVPAPTQTIVIQPAQPDTVYVPEYDPETVYGEPVAAYPGYTWVPPPGYAQPGGYGGYSTGQIVATGAIAFGVGIVVGALLDHHHHHHYDDGGYGPNPNWDWNSWGMNWGGPAGPNGGYGYGGYGNSGYGEVGWRRPAVVHDNTLYVSRSTTVVNRYVTNNINNSRTINTTTYNNQTYDNGHNRYVNNTTNNRIRNDNTVNEHLQAQRPGMQAMTTPHFGTPVRGEEPARFEQARTAVEQRPATRAMGMPMRGAEPARPTARPETRPVEAPREVMRSPQPSRPEQTQRRELPAVRDMPRFQSARTLAPVPQQRVEPRQEQRPVERPAFRPEQGPAARPVERPAYRPEDRPAYRPMERAQPTPRPEARPEPRPYRPAERPQPVHREAPRPAPRQDDKDHH